MMKDAFTSGFWKEAKPIPRREAPDPELSRRQGGRGLLPTLLLCGLFLSFFTFLLAQLHAQKFFLKAAKRKGNSARPAVRIPVKSLGYLPPGVIPAFDHQALVGLHFIDETHLLFTFNIEGLLQRDHKCSASDSQRMVRTVVLDIPSGKVEKRADWELYDFNDYLWGLGDGQFLLRRCSQFDLVGASLDPHPLIDGSGTIQGTFLSPDRSVAVVEESDKAPALPQSSAASAEDKPAKMIDVEFIRLHPLEIIARSRIPFPGVIPILAQGVLELLSGPHNRWIVDVQPFQGTARQLVTMQSFCKPALKVISSDIFLAMMCPKAHQMVYRAYNFEGSLLWQMPFTADHFLPRFMVTEDGAHFAIEALHLTHPIAALDPLTREDVDGLVIDVYDTLTGISIGSLRTTPIYTAGENADFSPDGTRLAVLRNGAIEIYTLKELAKNRR